MIHTKAYDRFLSVFSDFDRKILNRFTKKLSSTQADIYLVMARKAACLIEAFDSMGVLSLNGTVVSERVLDLSEDFLHEFFRGKSVVIIDDTIVSGTTIGMTIEKLINYEIKDIQISVLTVNERWYSEELIKAHSLLGKQQGINISIQQPIKLSDADSIRFCYDIVKGISIIPNDFDFPRFNIGKIREKKAVEIFSQLGGWIYRDTASKIQEEENIFSYTAIPTSNTCRAIDNYLGINLSGISNFKIRIMGKANSFEVGENKGTSNFVISAVPMIIFDAVSKIQINELYSIICASSKQKEIFTTEKARLRFLQYYFSLKILAFWYEQVFGESSKDLLRRRNLVVEKMLFTQSGMAIINDIEDKNTKLDYVLNPFLNVSNSPELVDKKEEINEVCNDFVLKNKLLEPFIDFYYQKEIPCRKAVKNYNYKKFSFDDFKDYFSKQGIDLKRLEKGITFHELVDRIAHVPNCYDYKTYTSIFLDKMISRGIAVPVLQEVDNCVVRAYRHGEDAIVGDAENQMITTSLGRICKLSKREKLTKIETEKILSLFIKFGVNQKWIEVLQNDSQKLEHDKIVVVNRHDMHGMRAAIKNTNEISDSFSFGHQRWFVPYLVKKGYIQGVDGGYVFNKEFETNLSDSELAKDDIDIFTRTFSEVLKYFDKKGDDLSEIFTGGMPQDSRPLEWTLTKIASCIYPKDQIDALASEIDIFKSNWNEFFSCDFQEFMHTKLNNIPQYNNALIAINSGQKKYFAYKNSEAKILLQNIKKTFKDPIYSSLLGKIIDTRLEDTKQINTENVIDDLGHWLVGVNFAIRLLDLCVLLYQNSSYSDYFKVERSYYRNLYNTISNNEIDSKNEILLKLEELKTQRGFKPIVDAIADIFFYEYRIKKINRNLRSFSDLLNVKERMFIDGNPLWDIIGNQVLDILQFLYNRAAILLVRAADEIEYYDKPAQKRYYQHAIIIKPSLDIYDNFLDEITQAKININNKDKNNLMEVCLSQQDKGVGNISILFANDDDYTESKVFLKIIKKYIIGIENLIYFNGLPPAYAYRVLMQNYEPRVIVHDHEVIEVINKVHEYKTPPYLIEIGSSDCSLLSDVGLKEKASKVFEMDDGTKLSLKNYSISYIDKNKIEIGIITALKEEFDAMIKLLLHARFVPIRARGEGHNYIFGYLPTYDGKFCPVAVCCINGMGNTISGIRTGKLITDIPNLKYIIMTGIAGGMPFPSDITRHVRLGDVVFSEKEGIIQYDFVKITEEAKNRGVKLPVSSKLLEAVKTLAQFYPNKKQNIMQDILANRPVQDVLHDYKGNIIEHPKDETRDKEVPKVFVGKIGAANILLKNAELRDKIGEELNLRAFEMEGSGVADASWSSEAHYMVVRGICDYCDEYKDDVWHEYAAAVAAAYTKWLIYYLTL